MDSLRKESVHANELLKQIVDDINAEDPDGFVNIGSLLDALDNYCKSAQSKWLAWAVKNEQLQAMTRGLENETKIE